MSTGNTIGEKLVGIDFNPSNLGAVAQCKQRFAEAINQLEQHQEEAIEHGTLTADKQMLLCEAKKRIVDAQMWAVKALTWGRD